MLDEEKCLKAIGQGREEALRQLYEHYSDRVFNTLISYTRNSEDAEELLQDVFITIYNTAVNFQFNSSVSTWIYRIAVNRALDFIRKKNTQKRFGIFTSLYKKDSSEVIHESSDFVHPGVTLERSEDAKLLFRAIETLPEHQKTAYILTQVEGLPQKEAAEIMAQSRKAVESLVSRAKSNLEKELIKYFPERGKT